MEKQMVISPTAKSFKRICACCHRELCEEEIQLCFRCEELQFDAMMERREADMEEEIQDMEMELP